MRCDMCTMKAPNLKNVRCGGLLYEIEEIGNSASIFVKNDIIECSVGDETYYKMIIRVYLKGYRSGFRNANND